MKLLQDRLLPFVESKKLVGKKGILIAPSEEGENACTYLVGMFKHSLNYLGMELTYTLLPKASEKAEIKNQPNIIAKATSLGKKLK